MTHTTTAMEVIETVGSTTTEESGKVFLANRTHNVRRCLFMSGDYRTRWDVGVIGANIQIIRVINGVDQSPSVSTAHNIPANVPIEFQWRVEAGTIYGKTIAADVTPVETSFAPAADTMIFTKQGFASSFDGARILAASVCEVSPILNEVGQVAVVVRDGGIYASYNGTGWELLLANAFPTTARVAFVERDGVNYAFGGGKGYVIDVAAEGADRVKEWGDELDADWTDATTGRLPGATLVSPGVYKKGTTSATVGEYYGDRVCLGAGRNAYLSASGDEFTPHRWNPAEPVVGAAVIVAPISDLIVAMKRTPWDTLLFAGQRTLHEVFAPTALAQVQKVERSSTIGVTGPNSFCEGKNSEILAHGFYGVYIVTSQGVPTSLNSIVLTEGIGIPQGEAASWYVSIVRDEKRQAVLVFQTPAANFQGRHWFYYEPVGAYSPMLGGWYEITMQAHQQPSLVLQWNGEPHLFCMDGFVRKFSDAANDDDGWAIDSKLPLALIDPGLIDADSVVDRVTVELSDASSPVRLVVVGGHSAENAYDVSGRTLATHELGPGQQPAVVGQRAPAIVATMQPANGGVFAVEAVTADVEAADKLDSGPPVLAPAVGEPCTSPVPGTGGDGGGDDGGGGGGGGGETCVSYSVPEITDSVCPLIEVLFGTYECEPPYLRVPETAAFFGAEARYGGRSDYLDVELEAQVFDDFNALVSVSLWARGDTAADCVAGSVFKTGPETATVNISQEGGILATKDVTWVDGGTLVFHVEDSVAWVSFAGEGISVPITKKTAGYVGIKTGSKGHRQTFKITDLRCN